ncbi:MAG: ester cyclase [bacterium]
MSDASERVEAFYREIWNRHDAEFIPVLLRDAFTFRGSLGQTRRGHAEFAGYVDFIHAALGEYRCDIVDLVSEADKVFARMLFSGVHRAEFLGFAPTFERVEWAGAALFTFEEGKIADVWVLGDLDTLRTQLAERAAAARVRNPDFEHAVRESFARQAFMSTLGATLERVAPGRIEIALPHSPALTQQNGFLHAGAIASIADSACGYAALTLAPPDHDVLAVEFKINLMRPATGARFLARGHAIRAGRALSTCRAEVYALRPDGRVAIAEMTSTVIARATSG